MRRFALLQPRKRAPEQRHHSAGVEVDDHLVMLHALPALHRTEITHETVVTVTHPGQSTILEHGAENALADDSVKS
jgi:hypothetical protein